MNSYTSIKAAHLIMRKEKILQWQPAPCGKLKLNLEGPIIHGTNFVGIGVLLRNEAGEVLC